MNAPLPVAAAAAVAPVDRAARQREVVAALQAVLPAFRSALGDRLGTQLRSEMHTGFADLRTGFADLRTEFVEATNRQIKWLVTFAASWTTVLVTLVRITA